MALVVVFFAVSFLTILICVGLASSFFKSKQKKQFASMLRKAEETPAEQRGIAEMIRPAKVEDFLSKLLRRFKVMDRLDRILEQSGKNWTSSKLIVISCVACGVGFLIGLKLRFVDPEFGAPTAAILGGLIPLMLVLRKRAKTIRAFEEQFPEALDFLSRSMRAGHGFTIALEMLGSDSPDPLGSAFRRVSNELQLGSSLEVALAKLIVLVPLVDVRFFASSVLLQQETGGNLGEILTKLAQIIRERFRLKGQVRAVSAHGRITGLVLVLMPAAVAAFMLVATPQYLLEMAADKTGRALMYGAAIGQVIGYFVIRKIVNIKV